MRKRKMKDKRMRNKKMNLSKVGEKDFSSEMKIRSQEELGFVFRRVEKIYSLLLKEQRDV